MTKHFRAAELDDEGRIIFSAACDLDDDYDTIRKRNLELTSYGEDWGRIKAWRCETCTMPAPHHHNGYCFGCRPEMYDGWDS